MTKFVFRLASVPVAIFAVVMILGMAYTGYLAVTRVCLKEWVAAPILAVSAVLCIRVIVWLWSSELFWRRTARAAEVTAVAVFALMLPTVAHFESRVGGAGRAMLQLGAVALVGGAYLAARQWHARSGGRPSPRAAT